MTVGVIVPVRTPAPWLAEALDSVLAQEPPPRRVVVVDDGSAAPVRLEERHAAACELVRRESSGGPAAARGSGLERLDTDLVALADADDAWEPGKLAAQLAALERHPEAALCFGRAVVVGAGGAPTGERWRELPGGRLEARSLAPALYAENPIPTSSVVLRAAALHAAGGFAAPTPVAEDWDLWLRLVALGRPFVCEPAARVRYRRHAGGLTADVEALARAGLELHERHAGLVDEDARRRARAADLRGLARGLARRRRHREARAALREAAALAAPAPRDRALAAVLAVPALRAAAARRDPYPR